MTLRRTLIALTSLLSLAACGRDLASNTYTEGSTSGKVLEGVVISARPVTVKAHDKLQDNGTGALMGGAAGGVAGYQAGNGRGNTATTVGGALIGAVAGALIEDAVSTTEGMEYLVKLDAQYANDPNTKQTTVEFKRTKGNDPNISTNSQTDIVAVVQKADASVGVGSRVYVVYSGDRPRVVPAQPAAATPR